MALPGATQMTSNAAPSPKAEGVPPGRVLLVEDDDALLRSCRRVLEAAGFQVETASDGEQAKRALAERVFDAIVSDIAMPQVGGIELLKAIRGRALDVPVILMTAFAELGTALDAIEYGALAYLRKPFGLDALRDSVTKAVRINRLARMKREAVAHVGDEPVRPGDEAGLEAAFERALATLWMAFQPLVAVSRQEVIAYEALLRTSEPELPHPGAVLSAAARLGRLHELGRTIRARVASHIAACPAESVYVNLHGRDLLDDQLYAPDAPLTAFATRVVLEITERASLEEVKGFEGRARELRKLGFRLAIDDLGAGYAGLTSFAQLEPEVVKFDMSLVRGIDRSPVRQRLVGAMSAVFREMKTVVVAEGVETPAERDTLMGLGCDVLQGYLFAKPDRPFPNAKW
jgi:EAL domain-containing protein (putative c-di-GMP-specific phosphodiesterase class I)/CheY-like chemotaxis protein